MRRCAYANQPQGMSPATTSKAAVTRVKTVLVHRLFVRLIILSSFSSNPRSVRNLTMIQYAKILWVKRFSHPCFNGSHFRERRRRRLYIAMAELLPPLPPHRRHVIPAIALSGAAGGVRQLS